MKLTDAKLRALQAPGKHFDGGGLYLEATPAGGRYWRLKYRFNGKEKRLALGVYPRVSLKEARARREAARQLLSAGVDPGEQKKADKARAQIEERSTFEAVARDWLAHQAGAWSAITSKRICASFEDYVFPAIGSRVAAQLHPRDVAAIGKALEERGLGETAIRTLQRVKAIFRYAVMHERVPSNPMVDLMPAELLKPRRVVHRPALQASELPEYLRRLDAYDGDPTTSNALRLLMLTAVRPGELRGARWAEVDMEAALWRIPAERMKMKAPHLVPLSNQARAILSTQWDISGHRDLVFPSPFYPGKSLSENTFNSALARMGYKGLATAHGMRALFSTVANEFGHDPDAIERQLAHIERNEVRAAYHRTTYLKARTELMQWWADYIDSRRSAQGPSDQKAAGWR